MMYPFLGPIFTEGPIFTVGLRNHRRPTDSTAMFNGPGSAIHGPGSGTMAFWATYFQTNPDGNPMISPQ